jgi:arylsulfatase A
MSSKHALFTIGVLFVGASCFADGPKTNVILIMADDLGYETIGANGGQSYQTPHIDQLAAGGMRFERCNVQPLCTPTRVQLMTGMYNLRNYIQFGKMVPNAITFGNLLKDAGYATAVAGKWQLGGGKDFPQKLGFDEACLWQHTRRPSRYANPGLEYNGEERDFHNGEYGPKLVNDFALDFISRHKDRPFFLYYPMMLTHAPYQPTPDSKDWNPRAEGEDTNKNPKYFADMVAYMDKMIGTLIAKLDELEIRDNTLVIFLGDNGTGRGMMSKFKGATYIGGKGLTNARGMHVPLIVNCPGRVPAGQVNDDLIDSTDFLPTICEAAGAKIPDSLTVDGRSFWPQLRGEPGQPREWIYTWYAKNGGPKAEFEFVANKELKVYRNGRVFDLTSDPYEENPRLMSDLTGAQATAAANLYAVIAKYADGRPEEIAAASQGTPRKDRAQNKSGKGKKKNKRARLRARASAQDAE